MVSGCKICLTVRRKGECVQFLPLVVLLAVSPILIYLIWSLDRLITIEFEKFPEHWGADGRPFTSLRRRRDMPRTIRTWLATQRCMFVWLFVPPKWSKGDDEASRCARRLPVLFGLWVLVAMPLFALSGVVAAVFA